MRHGVVGVHEDVEKPICPMVEHNGSPAKFEPYKGHSTTPRYPRLVTYWCKRPIIERTHVISQRICALFRAYTNRGSWILPMYLRFVIRLIVGTCGSSSQAQARSI